MRKTLLNILLLSIVSQLYGQNHQASPPPNIVLFLVDDMGWQDTSEPFWTEATPFNRRYHTPNMEGLARQGMKFTQAYATPVCSPTRVSLLTGMNAARHRVTNWTLEKDETRASERNHPRLTFPMWNVNGLSPSDTTQYATYVTPLPFLLKQAGYHTIHVGKAHFGAIGTAGADPLNLGFDENVAGHAAGAPQSFYGLQNFGNTEQNKNSPWPVPGLEKYHGQDIYLTEALTREAVSLAQKAVDKQQPFFLYLSHYAVHAPIMRDQRFVQRYYDMGIDSTEAAYASMVEGMDKSLGDVMDFLERTGQADNTIILFMSDNGGLSASARGGERHTHNRPLASGKGSIYEGGIREPMLVKWPGVTQPGSVCGEYLIIEDFFPSMLEMAGIQSPETVQHVDGQSFVPFLHQPEQSPQERPLFWHYPNFWGTPGPGIGPHSAVRQGDWKLIYYHDGEHFELFNITADIGETNDLFKAEPAKAKALARVLSDYLRNVDAQMPSRKEDGRKVRWPDEVLRG